MTDTMNEQAKKVFTELVKVVIIELPKVPKEDDGTRLWPWTSLLKAQTKEDVEMLVKEKPELTPAGDVIIHLSASERERALYEMREMRRMDDIAQMRWATEQGEKRGIKLGEKRGQLQGEQRILDLLAAGKEPEEILKAYGR
jgi:predicted transposase/invertase (TIGR01784 family)